MHDTKFNYHFVTPILKSQSFIVNINILFLLLHFHFDGLKIRMRFRAKKWCNLGINRTVESNQIARITSDFKMGVIKLVTGLIQTIKYFTISLVISNRFVDIILKQSDSSYHYITCAIRNRIVVFESVGSFCIYLSDRAVVFS